MQARKCPAPNAWQPFRGLLFEICAAKDVKAAAVEPCADSEMRVGGRTQMRPSQRVDRQAVAIRRCSAGL